MIITKSKRFNLRYFLSRFMLVVAGVLVIFACLNARMIYNTSTFFYSMENLQSPRNLGSSIQATEAYLSDLKQIARFLLNMPTEDRRMIILYYNTFVNLDMRPSGKHGDRAVNLFLLQRLIFDLPQEFPENQARVFNGFFWEGKDIHKTEGTVNMLWPFEYDDGYLTIKAIWAGSFGLYDGAREYDYFSSQFNFRSIDELK